MKNQQGAPEALFYADALDRCAEVDFDHIFVPSAAVIRRLHAENERLAALVDAQQPTPSAAAVGDEQKALKALHYYMTECSGHEPSISVFHRMVEEALAPQPSPTPQADSALKDHQIAALVNELRDIAIKYHATQQLRERIARAVVPALRTQQPASAPQADSQPAPVLGYPPLPDLIGSVWPFIHANAAADSAAMVAKTSDQVDAEIHKLLRAYVDADRAARGGSTP